METQVGHLKVQNESQQSIYSKCIQFISLLNNLEKIAEKIISKYLPLDEDESEGERKNPLEPVRNTPANLISKRYRPPGNNSALFVGMMRKSVFGLVRQGERSIAPPPMTLLRLTDCILNSFECIVNSRVAFTIKTLMRMNPSYSNLPSLMPVRNDNS